MDLKVKLENPCNVSKEHCINCHSHFAAVRPFLKGVSISRHFLKDMKSEREARSVVNDVLDCSNVNFLELHKFEENVDGNLIFRAKKEGMHVVYCINKNMEIGFLRAFRNYKEYGKFLEDKGEIKRMISNLKELEQWDSGRAGIFNRDPDRGANRGRSP